MPSELIGADQYVDAPAVDDAQRVLDAGAGWSLAWAEHRPSLLKWIDHRLALTAEPEPLAAFRTLRCWIGGLGSYHLPTGAGRVARVASGRRVFAGVGDLVRPYIDGAYFIAAFRSRNPRLLAESVGLDVTMCAGAIEVRLRGIQEGGRVD